MNDPRVNAAPPSSGADSALPPWLAEVEPVFTELSDADCLQAIRHTRAISWHWRFWELVRRPRLWIGIGRRHYGVAAQDVDEQLGLVHCDSATCPRHSGGEDSTECTGRLRVDYGLLAAVVVRAGRALNRKLDPNSAIDVVNTLPPVPSKSIQRYCYQTIAAIRSAADNNEIRAEL